MGRALKTEEEEQKERIDCLKADIIINSLLHKKWVYYCVIGDNECHTTKSTELVIEHRQKTHPDEEASGEIRGIIAAWQEMVCE